MVKKYFTPEELHSEADDEALIAAVVMQKWLGKKTENTSGQTINNSISDWAKNRRRL